MWTLSSILDDPSPRSAGSPTRKKSHPQLTHIVLCPTAVHPVRNEKVTKDVSTTSPTSLPGDRLGSSSSAPVLGISSRRQQDDDVNFDRARTADSENWRQGASKKKAVHIEQRVGSPKRLEANRSGACHSAWNFDTIEFENSDDDGQLKTSLDQVNVDELFSSMLAKSKKSPYEGFERAHTPKPKLKSMSRRLSNSLSKDESSVSPKSMDTADFSASATTSSSGWPLSPHGKPDAKNLEDIRQALRNELKRMVGGEMEAFRSMDLSGSGQVSFQEFAHGLTRLAINWQEVTGLESLRKVFRLFDQRKEGALKFADIFPGAQQQDDASYRLNTPDFLDWWCTRNHSDQKRRPKWQMGKDDKLEALFHSAETHQYVNGQKRWISSTMRRMKKMGKTDAYCREKCALHLPKGTGPLDEEGKKAFSELDVRLCKRNYKDKIHDSVHNVHKTVAEMRDQRFELAASRKNMAKLQRKRDIHRDVYRNSLFTECDEEYDDAQ